VRQGQDRFRTRLGPRSGWNRDLNLSLAEPGSGAGKTDLTDISIETVQLKDFSEW
jgi:hypothetical protein